MVKEQTGDDLMMFDLFACVIIIVVILVWPKAPSRWNRSCRISGARFRTCSRDTSATSNAVGTPNTSAWLRTAIVTCEIRRRSRCVSFLGWDYTVIISMGCCGSAGRMMRRRKGSSAGPRGTTMSTAWSMLASPYDWPPLWIFDLAPFGKGWCRSQYLQLFRI